MQQSERKYILALETAIDGGSISILDNEVEIDFIKGNQDSSKSEDLLTLMDDLLNRSKIEKQQIKMIAVSTGAGSLTGLRIGKALALGLGNSLNIKIVEVNFLDALLQQTNPGNDVFSAVYAGKSKFLYKENSTGNGEIKTSPVTEFNQKYEDWKKIEKAAIILSENLHSVLTNEEWNKVSSDSETRVIEGNLSKLVGLKAKKIFASDNE